MSVRKIFKIEGMSCSHCEHSVDMALKKPGIRKAEVSLKNESAKVEFDPGKITEADIKVIIEEAGYNVISITD